MPHPVNEMAGCDVFSGPSGKAVVLGLTSGAFFTYMFLYWLRRTKLKNPDGTPKECRPPKIFFFDLTKLAAGQGSAWLINLANTHRNSHLGAGSYDPLSWYFPTFLADEIFAVPLGVAIGRLVCYGARRLRDDYSVISFDCLARFGRYHPHSARPAHAAGGGLQRESLARPAWWAVQLFVWVLCVMISRVVGGFALPLFGLVFGNASPFYLIATAIYDLDWSCGTKRFVFAGFLRIAIDLLQIAVVDFFNKYVNLARVGPRTPEDPDHALEEVEFPPHQDAQQIH
eukprot:NODE_5202_length_970_cov_56.675325_g4990_i0.p1 GENE.NODE_5202_length_970_cov_56.675325_g4990_i0~~NODE_5202_length_970_cov_56.675325_g4990_i0.p1  ORF type:complete len:298 (+),score=40.67 NODE_5202_length_970_cov_56.675325_g4990_i0:41-895(+)